jgi:hypothetical protein
MSPNEVFRSRVGVPLCFLINHILSYSVKIVVLFLIYVILFVIN